MTKVGIEAQSPGDCVSRRRFLYRAARYGVGGGLLAGVSLLVLGVTDDPADRQRCVRPITCGGCDVFDKCLLPKAQAQRVVLHARPGTTWHTGGTGDPPVPRGGGGGSSHTAQVAQPQHTPGGSFAASGAISIRRT